MSEPAGILLGRTELERAFTMLGERLVRRGVVADLFVVGGAAMALAYDAERITRDVDAMFVPHGIVLEEAQAVADELGLPRWWLNEQASVYVSGKNDPGKRRVFDHPGLRVMAASPDHLFAMKALAGRTRDIDDLRALAVLVGIDTVQAAIAVCTDSSPTNRSPHAPSESSMNSSATTVSVSPVQQLPRGLLHWSPQRQQQQAPAPAAGARWQPVNLGRCLRGRDVAIAEKWKVGGSTPPLPTSLNSANGPGAPRPGVLF
ncbi:DUF6036 family nucleotidyltransferase [Actinomadura rubrisoli]|uniref:DUF6036 domain-containing protein n=1 Tax=Actinomadura rubrisoli TaxID=2530368 RepID=A0A4R5CDX0_9ACTN|nr:DUF6036 family nucleotidyltransferase [Actinomadura rubrisoli]TDD95374.1 hypothetical protein E1298_05245 [Actinomadura rubrisoli]